MSSVGEPLWAARSIWEFLDALYDAILGECASNLCHERWSDDLYMQDISV